MSLETRKQFDVLVVGGGPAGLSAAAAAAQAGVCAGVVDDNPALGGQIWRGEAAHPGSPAADLIGKLRAANVEVHSGTRIFDQPEPGILCAETTDGYCELRYGTLILATGARERFLPFPGWTLPNVMGAGALQALVKSGLPLRNKRVVVAGTGPLLLAVAAYLKGAGAEIAAICEQTTRVALAQFAVNLLSHREKISQAFALRKQLAGVTFLTSAWATAAEGSSTLDAVVISRNGRKERIPCHYLACGFHLVPNTELAALLGCRLKDGFVDVDDFQKTSVPNILCAGEPTGIGGVELAILEGQIAGLSAAGREESAKSLFGERRKLRTFAQAMDRAFALRSELQQIAQPQTIVCRCEDVTYARLKPYRSWRAAKLHTRCGMGPCQGRICGPATEFLLGWTPDSVRPPIFPTTLRNLAVEPGRQLHGTV